MSIAIKFSGGVWVKPESVSFFNRSTNLLISGGEWIMLGPEEQKLYARAVSIEEDYTDIFQNREFLSWDKEEFRDTDEKVSKNYTYTPDEWKMYIEQQEKTVTELEDLILAIKKHIEFMKEQVQKNEQI